MAYDFPSSPTVGQKYLGFVWDGEKWTNSTSYVTGLVIASDNPPAAAAIGSLWWETDTGNLYFLFNDGTSTQWVMIQNQTDIAAAGAVVYTQAQGLTYLQQAQGRSNVGVTRKNYIINGAMQISQENGNTAVTTNNSYPVDQFLLSYSNAGTQTAQQVASLTPGGSPNRLRVTATVADAAVGAGDYCFIRYALEGLKVADLRMGLPSAKTIIVQFGVKAPAGVYCLTMQNLAGTRTYAAEYTIAAGEANTDVVKSVTIPLDTTGVWATDNTMAGQLLWTLMSGTTYQTTPNSWQPVGVIASPNQSNFMGTAGNVFELFDVGVYEGTVAPPYMLPDYATELTACQRYLWMWKSSAAFQLLGIASIDQATTAQMILSLPTVLRGLPAVSGVAMQVAVQNVTAYGLYQGYVPSIHQNIIGISFTTAGGLIVGQAGRVMSNSGGTTSSLTLSARL